jgi:hypothetical protein
MTAQHEHTSSPEIRARMKGAIVKVIAKARRREWPRFDIAAPAPTQRATDPFELLSFAINTLGAASYRAAVFGTPVTVFAPDEAAAEVLRAALRDSSVDRPTNRLIRVAVAEKGA